MPFYTYILQSISTGRKYYGSCEILEKRLIKHNTGRVKSTKAYRPYRILYSEEHNTRSEAYLRERYFKTFDGYNFLKAKKII